MTTDKTTKLFFDEIKESRGHYFVKYLPPGGDIRFASLRIFFHKGVAPTNAKACMEAEAEVWTARYSIPVMVSAFDEKGNTVAVSSSWKTDHLIAWKRLDGEIENRWELAKEEEIPDEALSINYLLNVYHDINLKISEDLLQKALHKNAS